MSDQTEAVQDRIQRHLAEKVRVSEEAFRAIQAEMAAKGLSNSGASIRRRLALLEQLVVDSTDWAFGEVDRHTNPPDVARALHALFLRQAMSSQFYALVDKSGLQDDPRTPPAAATEVQRQVERIRQSLTADLKEFEQGLWTPRSVDRAPPVANHNVVHVAGDFVGAVQQGGSGNVQVAPITVNWAAVRETAQQLSDALSSEGIGLEVREALEPDLHTIQAQLRKPSPGEWIVREAARSLRNVAEGALAGALVAAPAVAALLHQLAQQVGLG